MNERLQKRLYLVVALAVGLGALGFLSFGNIGESLVYFWNPTELHAAGDRSIGATIRLGGIVKTDTLDWRVDTQDLYFTVTDNDNDVSVHATGAPPQMMREGIGVVVEGTMTESGTFETDRLMVKHSNEYKVPQDGVDAKELYDSLEDES